MRVFTAIFPPLQVREALRRRARNLPVRGDVRCIKSSNIHLTLKFLGDTQEAYLDEVGAAIAAVCENHEPFEIEPRGFGAFPSDRKARILWAGISEGSRQLRNLAKDLENTLEPLGFARERRAFTPHITLCRSRGLPVSLGKWDPILEDLRFRANKIELMESSLRKDGAVYEVLKTFAFEGHRRTL